MALVYIGLGSNMGDREGNLRQARELLRAGLEGCVFSSPHTSQALLPEGADASWDMPFINQVMRGHTTQEPLAVLRWLKQIERDLGRQHRGHWAPREIDLDLLMYDDVILKTEELTLPHPEMHKRDFVMIPLGEIMSHPLEGGRQRASVAQSDAGGVVPSFAERPPTSRLRSPAPPQGGSKLVGILNLTPDSFSDGGKNNALEHIAALITEGAGVIDIGAESTRPNAAPVSPEEEWARLEPVLPWAINHWRGKVTFSLDTRHAATAAKALALGVDWINDVSGGQDPAIWQLLRQYPQARYVLMHSLSVPADPAVVLGQEVDVIEELLLFFATRMMEMQLEEHQVILDPGIGFGKTAEQSLEILRRIGELSVLRLPILVGHSRKSCFGGTLEHRDGATLAASIYLARQGVNFLRVHSVGMHAQALKTAEFFDV